MKFSNGDIFLFAEMVKDLENWKEPLIIKI
jgi:hypothetical protein